MLICSYMREKRIREKVMFLVKKMTKVNCEIMNICWTFNFRDFHG